MKPILKWAGGKVQLLEQIMKKINLLENYGTYYEPFFGGGALFFSLLPKKAIINDSNSELINLYEQIKDNPESVIKKLYKLQNGSTEKKYYEIRKMDRETWPIKDKSLMAARTIYLNKNCFNGLFRVNKSGQFNVPYGKNRFNVNSINKKNILEISRFFRKNKIIFKCGDFEKACKNIRRGSLVYLDPPYDIISKTSNFTGYTKTGFDRSEQIRVKNFVDKLTKKGVYVIVSNSKTDFISELYKEYKPFTEIVKASRNINSNIRKRGKISEVLIDNFDIVNKKL